MLDHVEQPGQPSGDPDPQRSCREKKRYPTEAVAEQVATQCWYERRVWLRAYPCEHCGGFHLTRKNAVPRMQPNWRLPELSARARAEIRKQEQRRGRKRRR